MPQMSDTMTEGVIVSWLKKEGDKVKSGDILAEVETDKATMELESYSDGVLLHIGAQPGASVPVNGVIAVIGEAGEDFNAAISAAGGAEAANAEGAAAAQAADAGSHNNVNAEVEGARPTPSQPHPQQAPVDKAPDSNQKPAEGPQPAEADEPITQSAQGDGRIKASPLAKRMAEEKNLDLKNIQGSGDGGRIVRKDIEGAKPAEAAPANAQPQASRPVALGQESFEDVPLSQMRKTIARRLAESKFSAPHFYLTIEADMDAAVEARTAINEFLGSKVSYNDMVIKAAAIALKRHPKVNASWLGDRIRYNHHVNIGVAIAVEDGLVVPVLRQPDLKPLNAITAEVKAYADKAKAKKLQPGDYEGNTFTISNLGMFGIEEFTAIINPPDACILAVGAIEQKPVVKNGELAIGHRMKCTLSCDHRVVDGATGAQFLQTLKQLLAQPVNMIA